MEKLSREQIREIVEEFLIDDVICSEMYEDGTLEDIAMELLDVETYGGWWRRVDIIGRVDPVWYACIPLQVSEELRKLKDEADLEFICETLNEKAEKFLDWAEIEVSYDDDEIDDLILVLDNCELQMDYDTEKIVECFLSEGWLDEVLNGEYEDKEEVIEDVKSFLDEEAYERLKELVEKESSFDEFIERLDKFLEFARQYIEEVCEELEEEEEEEEEKEQHIK